MVIPARYFSAFFDLVLFNIGMTVLWWWEVNPMLAATVLLLIIFPWGRDTKDA